MYGTALDELWAAGSDPTSFIDQHGMNRWQNTLKGALNGLETGGKRIYLRDPSVTTGHMDTPLYVTEPLDETEQAWIDYVRSLPE